MSKCVDVIQEEKCAEKSPSVCDDTISSYDSTLLLLRETT